MPWTSLVWWRQRLRTFPTICSSTCHMASTGDIEAEMFTQWCPGKHLFSCWPEDTTRALEPDRRMGWVWERTIKMMRTSGLTHFLIFMRNTNNTTKWNVLLCQRTKTAIVQQYHRAAGFPMGQRLKSGLHHVSIPNFSPIFFMCNKKKLFSPHHVCYFYIACCSNVIFGNILI